MIYLLDTHTFIWLDTGEQELSKNAQPIMADRSNVLLLSLVSVWKMQIKAQLGKLKLRIPLADIIEDQQRVNDIQLQHIQLRVCKRINYWLMMSVYLNMRRYLDGIRKVIYLRALSDIIPQQDVG